ncbi:YagK/YfjJ domain-containing protein [Vibrio crassostreae]|uniref:YagK/YfjJ domain-containing protein n=1 Tax=Vibrio crassostreae TaxID=246167 RepID=UPI001B3036FB|nr:inovirus-type Gp2 protein [Vibrio crassostreae]
MKSWMIDSDSPKSQISIFLNRYPNGLVVKLKLRASLQKAREGNKLIHDFLYRLQNQAHQLKKQDNGGFGCPILVSYKRLKVEDSSVQFLVAVTFNLEAFGRKRPEDIKKQVRRWIAMAWASTLSIGSHMVTPLVSFSPRQAFLCLRPGSSQYREAIETLERTFAGIGPDVTHPASNRFHHLEGFYPRKHNKTPIPHKAGVK